MKITSRVLALTSLLLLIVPLAAKLLFGCACFHGSIQRTLNIFNFAANIQLR